jgi:hypothetical protein
VIKKNDLKTHFTHLTVTLFGGCGDPLQKANPHPCSPRLLSPAGLNSRSRKREKTLEKLLKVYAVTHLRMILTPTLIGYEKLTTVMESIG